MKQYTIGHRRLSRRSVIKWLAGLTGGLGLGGIRAWSSEATRFGSPSRSPTEAAPPKPRLAIIGGGIGGIAAAYFCGPHWQVELCEARHKIGGHCDSITIDYAGHKIVVDLGAQFFHPDTHPLYVTLLEQLDLYRARDPEHDLVLQAEGSLSIFPISGGAPLFVSTHPLATPLRSLEFAIFTQKAREMILQDGSWDLTLEEWITGLPLLQGFKEQLLVPWIASLIGTPIATAKRTTARSILQTFALAFPEHVFEPASTYNSLIGLGGIIDVLATASQNLRIHLDAPVQRLWQEDHQWWLATPTRCLGPFEAVIVNAPPLASRTFLSSVSWAEALVAVLNQFEYFDTRLVIHTDPVYVPYERQDWTVYNAGIDLEVCEGSVWLGAIYEPVNGETIDVFKSWARHRRWEPQQILAERHFQHPLMTPQTIDAARHLKHWQGLNGLWFAGQHLTGMDLQEAGVYTAMGVAEALSPTSPTLQRFHRRLIRKGLQNITYDL